MEPGATGGEASIVPLCYATRKLIFKRERGENESNLGNLDLQFSALPLLPPPLQYLGLSLNKTSKESVGIQTKICSREIWMLQSLVALVSALKLKTRVPKRCLGFKRISPFCKPECEGKRAH